MRQPQFQPLRGALTLGRLSLLLLAGVAGPAASRGAEAQGVGPDYYAGMRWRSIGPYRAGYISSVSGIPGDPAVYYIGTPESGVWKTTSGGTVWKPIFDAEGVPSVGAVAVSPSDPAVVYVATGGTAGGAATPGNGVYRSSDSGKTWRNVGLRETQTIGALVVDPRNANVVLVGALGPRTIDGTVATARGVYRTADGGHTWKQTLYLDAYTGASEIVYDYSDPLVVYASLQRTAAGLPPADLAKLPALGAGIYKSIDGGVTWKQVGARGLPPGASSFAIAVASGTHGRRVYAEARNAGRGAAGPAGLYRSDDGGTSWSLGTKQIASAGGHIYADPKNPDVVYLMGTSMYRSVDGGHSFESFMGAPSGDDIRQLWIDPSNPRRMLIGSDQGPTVTVDGGETWSLWYNLPNGQFYRVSTDNDFPYHVCGPQQDSGTACVLSRSDFGEIRPNDWYPVGGFENGFVVTDPLNSRWIYTQGWYHVLRRYDRTTGQTVVLYMPSPQDHFGGAPPLAFSPQDGHVLYLGAQYVLASSDSGQHWRKLSPDLTVRPEAADPADAIRPGSRTGQIAVAAIQALVPSTVIAGQIWVGTGNGLIHLTRDGGATWTNVTPRGMAAGAVNIIDASHTNAGTAYASITSRDNHPHIYRTSDFGRSWQEIVAGLPADALVRVVREDPVNPSLLYAGTVTSAWVSFDRGDHWQSLQLNLPHTIVSDMTIHGSDLVISTYGRSFWILDDVSPLRQATTAAASTSQAFLFRPEPASRARWDNTQDTPLPKELPAGQNPPEGAIIDYYLKTPASGPITLSIADAAGHVIREFSSVAPPADTSMPNVPVYWFKPPVVLSTKAGMHRIAWDLSYPEPPALRYSYSGNLLDYTEYTLNWHSIPGETPRQQPTGPLVVPASYHLRLSLGGQSYSQDVTVVPDPRVPVSQAAMVAQLLVEQRIVAGMKASYEGFTQVQRLRKALEAVKASVAGKPQSAEVIAAAQALDDAAAALANATQGGFGPANRDLGRHLADMTAGDVQPSPSVVDAVETSCRYIDGAAAGFQRLQATSVSGLNAMLARSQLPALPAWTPPAAPACGPGGGVVP